MALWRLPGYVDGEGKWATVPSDVVAVMAPTGDAAAVPPHRNVNLRVEDADATVEQAVGLGGQVIAPALDTPGFRRPGRPAGGCVLDRSADRRLVGGRLVDSRCAGSAFGAVRRKRVG
jgi:hypothetical protein